MVPLAPNTSVMPGDTPGVTPGALSGRGVLSVIGTSNAVSTRIARFDIGGTGDESTRDLRLY
jgi:hypothetical protein